MGITFGVYPAIRGIAAVPPLMHSEPMYKEQTISQMNFYQKNPFYVLLCYLPVGYASKGVSRLPDGQFTSNDAYLFAGQAQEIADQGSPPSTRYAALAATR